MRAVTPRKVVNILEALLECALWAAEVRSHVRPGELFTWGCGYVGCLRQQAVPEEARFVYRVRGKRGDHPDIQHIVVGDDRSQAGRIDCRTSLHDDVAR